VQCATQLTGQADAPFSNSLELVTYVTAGRDFGRQNGEWSGGAMSSTTETKGFTGETKVFTGETKGFTAETKVEGGTRSTSFTGETKVKDIALSNPEARRVLEDAHVDYCCGGSKSLHDACAGAGVSAEDIFERLRENSKTVNPGAANWTSAPLGELTRHIREKHHGYVRAAIPRIQELLNKVNAKHGPKHPEIPTIGDLFTQVGREMIMHMQKEEQILFPYIEAVERAANGKGAVEPPFFQTVRNPIQMMMKEHDSAGHLVQQIREASAYYNAPAGACTSFKALYQELKQFEADLHEHVHLENNILFPRAVEAETAVVYPSV
jgi:regulator of cell morphogenesis and NO signaling